MHQKKSKMEIVIKLSEIHKTFTIRDKAIDSIRDFLLRIIETKKSETDKAYRALVDINLEIYKGEFLGIIGHNGSGKSTLLNVIMGSIVPDKGGSVFTKGKMVRLALGMGFDPGLSARENIYVNGSILGLTFKEIGVIFQEIINFAELNEFVEVPIKYYSTGMRSRLTFAIAIYTKADILLMDEFFGGVGDISFKQKSHDLFENRILSGRTIVHVNHNLNIIEKYCDRVLLLHKGKMIYIGDPAVAINKYQKLMQ